MLLEDVGTRETAALALGNDQRRQPNKRRVDHNLARAVLVPLVAE